MGTKIKIITKDFRIIEQTKILVDGIIGIVGENNHGKSALYNSIKTLCYNVAGTGYIRTGTKQASIGIRFEEDGVDPIEIFFNKSDSPSYKLNGVPYEKVGRGDPPDDIKLALNMSPLELGDDVRVFLNFLDQLQAPLLLQLSEVQLYNITIKSFDGEKINEAVKDAKKDIDEYRNQIKDKNIEWDVQKKNTLVQIEKLKIYEELDKLKEEFHDYQMNFIKIPALKAYMGDRNNVLDKIDKTKDVLKEFAVFAALEKQLKTTRETAENLAKYHGYKNRRNLLKRTIVHTQSLILDLVAIDHKFLKSYNKAKEDKKLIDELKLKSTTRNLTVSNIEIEKGRIKEVDEEVKKLQYQIDNKICPTCNEPITKGNTEMALAELATKIEDLKSKKSNYEGSLTTLETQLGELDEEIKGEGFDPENLDDEIEKTQKSVEAFEKKAKPIVDKIEKSIQKKEAAIEESPGSTDMSMD